MCTVSYIPTSEGFFLTSNRDENPDRKTLPIQDITLSNGEQLKAPIDFKGGGSWMASNQTGKVACLLNGAFVKHKRELPYRKSRGKFVFEAFEYPSFSEFIEKTDLENIEPFTVILIDDFLQVMIWDGQTKHRLIFDKNASHIWSSSTLYTQDEHIKKYYYFMDSIKNMKPTPEEILTMHGLKSKTPFILDYAHVKTVSITQFTIDSKKSELAYHLIKAKTNVQKKVLY